MSADTLTLDEVAALCGFTTRHVERLISKDRFPLPTGERRSRGRPARLWSRDAIEQWLAANPLPDGNQRRSYKAAKAAA